MAPPGGRWRRPAGQGKSRSNGGDGGKRRQKGQEEINGATGLGCHWTGAPATPQPPRRGGGTQHAQDLWLEVEDGCWIVGSDSKDKKKSKCQMRMERSNDE